MRAPDLVNDPSWLEAIRRERLAVLLDLDGTLIPFAARAEDAGLDAAAGELLGELSAAGVQIVIVTGRPQRLVEHMCERVPHAWWFAEHGAWHRCGGGWTGPRSEAPELRELAGSLSEFLQVAGTRLEHKSLALALHWRGVSPEQREAAIAAAELTCEEWLETRPHCERIDGVEMLEVRLRSIHKGTAVARVRERLPGASIIAIGDDETDEDMFAALGERDLPIAVRNLQRRRQPRAALARLAPPGARVPALAARRADEQRAARSTGVRDERAPVDLRPWPPRRGVQPHAEPGRRPSAPGRWARLGARTGAAHVRRSVARLERRRGRQREDALDRRGGSPGARLVRHAGGVARALLQRLLQPRAVAAAPRLPRARPLSRRRLGGVREASTTSSRATRSTSSPRTA